MLNRRLPLLLLIAGALALSACDSLDDSITGSFFVGTWTVTDVRDSGGSVWPDVVNEVGGANMEFQNDGDLIFSFNEPSEPDTTAFSHEAEYNVVPFANQMVISSNIDGTPIAYIFDIQVETDNRVQLAANAEAAELINLMLSQANIDVQLSGGVTISIQRNASE